MRFVVWCCCCHHATVTLTFDVYTRFRSPAVVVTAFCRTFHVYTRSFVYVSLRCPTFPTSIFAFTGRSHGYRPIYLSLCYDRCVIPRLVVDVCYTPVLYNAFTVWIHLLPFSWVVYVYRFLRTRCHRTPRLRSVYAFTTSFYGLLLVRLRTRSTVYRIDSSVRHYTAPFVTYTHHGYTRTHTATSPRLDSPHHHTAHSFLRSALTTRVHGLDPTVATLYTYHSTPGYGLYHHRIYITTAPSLHTAHLSTLHRALPLVVGHFAALHRTRMHGPCLSLCHYYHTPPRRRIRPAVTAPRITHTRFPRSLHLLGSCCRYDAGSLITHALPAPTVRSLRIWSFGCWHFGGYRGRSTHHHAVPHATLHTGLPHQFADYCAFPPFPVAHLLHTARFALPHTGCLPGWFRYVAYISRLRCLYARVYLPGFLRIHR